MRKRIQPPPIRMLVLALLMLAVLILPACELIAPKPEAPTIHMLVISLDYKNTTSVLELNGTIRDAKEFHAAMQSLGLKMGTGIQTTLMLQEGTARLYTDPLYPTKTHILEQLEAFAAEEEIKSSDIFILYYSGHGIGSAFDTENPNRGNLVTARPNDTDAYETLAIQDVKDALQEIKATKLMMVDACYSGHFVTEYPSTKEMRIVLGSGYDPDLYYLTAASDVQLSFESNLDGYGNHGYFTYYLLKALGWDHSIGNEIVTSGIITQVRGAIPTDGSIPVLKDSRILVTDIHDYLSKSLKARFGLFFNQTPQTGKGPMDMVLFDSTWEYTH